MTKRALQVTMVDMFSLEIRMTSKAKTMDAHEDRCHLDLDLAVVRQWTVEGERVHPIAVADLARPGIVQDPQ